MKKIHILVASGVLLLATGCSPMPGNPAEDYVPPTAETFDQQIEKVKSDPNMSDVAKEQAIKGIEMARSMSQQHGKSAGRG